MSGEERAKFVKRLILGLLLVPILLPQASLADAEKVFIENNGAVVVIIAYNSEREPIAQGSGFAVRQDGVVVTSYHVINKSADLEVKVQNPKRVVTESLKVEGLIYVDKDNDLAILKVKFNDPQSTSSQWVPISQPLKQFTVVRLGDIDKANIGEKLYVISSPAGFENTISEGILSGLRDFRWGKPALLPSVENPAFEPNESWETTWLKTLRHDRKMQYRRKVLQFTAPISPGSTGGPVFNRNGEVIGIVTFLIKQEQNLNFAMPVNLIKPEIENSEVIPLGRFREEFENEYVKSLAETLADQDGFQWRQTKIPKNRLIDICKEVLKLNPNHGFARFNLVIDYYVKGEKDKAAEHYIILKRVDPNWAKSVTLLFSDPLFK